MDARTPLQGKKLKPGHSLTPPPSMEVMPDLVTPDVAMRDSTPQQTPRSLTPQRRSDKKQKKTPKEPPSSQDPITELSEDEDDEEEQSQNTTKEYDPFTNIPQPPTTFEEFLIYLEVYFAGVLELLPSYHVLLQDVLAVNSMD